MTESRLKASETMNPMHLKTVIAATAALVFVTFFNGWYWVHSGYSGSIWLVNKFTGDVYHCTPVPAYGCRRIQNVQPTAAPE